MLLVKLKKKKKLKAVYLGEMKGDSWLMIGAPVLINKFYLELYHNVFSHYVYLLTVAYSPCSGYHQSIEYTKKTISDQQDF